MIKEIISGYAGVLRTIAKVVALVAVCLAFGICIVWPLWYVASTHPDAYTTLFCVIAGAVAIVLFGFAAFRSFKKDHKAFLVHVASILVLVVGAIASVYLVLSFHRIIALAVVVITLIAYGFLAFALAPGAKKTRLAHDQQ
jgi:hypothetical protein